MSRIDLDLKSFNKVTKIFRWRSWWLKAEPKWIKGTRPVTRYIPLDKVSINLNDNKN